MNYDALASFARLTVITIVAGFLIAVLYRLAAGHVRTRGLLSADDGMPSPNNVQLLLITIAGGLWYAGLAVEQGALPDVPPELLAVIGGSHLTFIGTKTFSWFFGEERERLRRS